jgi:hypothetical protein
LPDGGSGSCGGEGMIDQPSNPVKPRRTGSLMLAALFLITAIFSCSIYANLSFAVTNTTDLRYFPPFKPHVNGNGNRRLGFEYYQMARAIWAGEGFSHPMHQPTGPTAWQPPILPLIMAAILWVSDGDRDMVMAVVVFLQTYVLIGTGLLILAVVRETTRRIGPIVASAVFAIVLLSDFRLWFQQTFDAWIVLLAVDLLVAGLCWLSLFHGWKTAIGWGLFGGLCALINPIAGCTWAVCSVAIGVRQRHWNRLAITLLVSGLILAPWTIRNYVVFGRFIPVKSNLAFEMYQSQCLQQDGLLRKFINHPYWPHNPEGKQYKTLGESVYLDRKREQFWQSVRSDPLDFCDRVAYRFFGATLWYVPFNDGSQRWSSDIWICRVLHPIPFLALLVLAFSAFWQRLHVMQWIVISVYVLNLLPYVAVSYYERYAMPLVAVKILMVLSAADLLLCQCCKEAFFSRVLGSSMPLVAPLTNPSTSSDVT